LWADVAALSPEILIVSPCGFGVEEAAEQAKQLLERRGWNDLPAVLNDRVFAVNANAYFARSGLRVVDGVELLAHLIHPEACDWRGSRNAFRQIHFSDNSVRPVRVKDLSRIRGGRVHRKKSRNGGAFPV
jgi:iron complex transport system substrate-binding protein